MAKYLVTGSAGFIGARVSEMLLALDHHVVGIDNLNQAYDVRVKNWRLEMLKKHNNFTFFHLDISNREGLSRIFPQTSNLQPVDVL